MKNLIEIFGDENAKQNYKKAKNNLMIVDFSNIFWSSYYIEQSSKQKVIDEENEHDFFIYLLFITILSIKNQFKQYKDIVFAIDSGSWRKDVFKYYKAKRKLARQGKDKEKFEKLFETVDYFLDTVKGILPFKFLKIDKSEADDIIASLVWYLNEKKDKILIVSRDKDFKQLLRFKNVKLYDPIMKKELIEENPEQYLLNHIINGDSSDGIPNAFSEDNIFLQDGKRQKSFSKKLKESLLELGIDKFVVENGIVQNYNRNRKLIELSSETIPEDIFNETIYQYNNYSKNNLNEEKLLEFFQKHRLKTLYSRVNEFII